MNIKFSTGPRFCCCSLLFLLSSCAVNPAPPATDQAVRFAFGGDLAGQNVCRDLDQGFPIFHQVLARRPDFFVALGDMIYADDVCTAIGRYGNQQVPRATGIASDEREFLAHWDYVRADPGFAELLRSLPYYAVWDDHEVQNDFSPGKSGRETEMRDDLIAQSRTVFERLHETGPGVLYFRKEFGQHLEVFFLDTRSYRDAKTEHDTIADPKTMLGAQQREWLQRSVVASIATWKVIVSSVPLAIPTGWPPEGGRDGWADYGGSTGYEQELLGMLRYFAERDVNNLVVISADVHFASGFRYRPFAGFPDFILHEFVTGPLQAGLFPSTQLDESLGPERLFYYAPESVDAVSNFESAVGWFNFGLLTIATTGQLEFELVDGYGEQRARLTIQPR